MGEKKRILTYTGLRALEEELENLKVVRRKEVAVKIREAREQGDLSENAEYDAAKDEQRDIETRIEEIEKILKNVEVVDEDEVDLDKGEDTESIPVPDATKPETMEKPIPVMIDMSQSGKLTEVYGDSGNALTFGIVANAPNTDMVLNFIDFLME